MIATAEAIDTLESDLASLADEINSIHGKLTVDAMLKIGERLDAANAELSHKGDGRFNKWIDENLSISRMTANNYMAAYRAFGGKQECKSLLRSSPLEAIYALARKPDAVIDEFAERADDGERITLAKVKDPAAVQADEPLALSDAVLRLQRVLRGVMKWFPAEHKDALANRLLSAGDEILTTGGIR
jgi:hypothetical protein